MKRSVVAAMLFVLSGFAAGEDAAKAPAPEQSKTATQAPEPAKVEAPVLMVEKSTAPAKCEIKPVMTDDELRACGARIAK